MATATSKSSLVRLPKDQVEKSCGLAIDSGGSVTKILYRSKDEYEGGKRKDDKGEDYGVLHTTSFPREDMDTALRFILEHCDLTRHDDGRTVVKATGLGANKYGETITKTLNAKLEGFVEFSCFSKALVNMVKNSPPEEIFLPHPALARELALDFTETYRLFFDMGSLGEFPTEEPTEEVYRGLDDTTGDFPCLMVMCGSGFLIFLIQEDGSQTVVNVSSMGGRYFLGSCGVMTGITDYKTLEEMTRTCDGRSVDLYTRDMTTEGASDGYSSINQKDMLIFPFGKGCMRPREEIKDGDLVQSTARLLSENLGQIVNMSARANKVRRAFFCGSFVSSEFVQSHILTTIYTYNHLTPKEERLRVDFLNHGGFLGAIGAFMS